MKQNKMITMLRMLAMQVLSLASYCTAGRLHDNVSALNSVVVCVCLQPVTGGRVTAIGKLVAIPTPVDCAGLQPILIAGSTISTGAPAVQDIFHSMLSLGRWCHVLMMVVGATGREEGLTLAVVDGVVALDNGWTHQGVCLLQVMKCKIAR